MDRSRALGFQEFAHPVGVAQVGAGDRCDGEAESRVNLDQVLAGESLQGFA
jgi:hypothetical protein